MPILSLCIPTNGVVEWVFPVLDSIFLQNCDTNKFEVVITDNGNNAIFKKRVKEYIEKYDNIKYYETTALPFLNEIESYKKASGEFLKYVNHRTKLLPGTLKKLIEYVEDNMNSKPITYFSNGVLKMSQKEHEYKNFDSFVSSLSYWSSWSTGMAIWKRDFEKLPSDVTLFNELFPHTDVLFSERKREKYIIDNTLIFDELPQKKTPKGNYNLFFAFGIEYLSIILDLYKNKDISIDTFKNVKNDNLKFVASLYFEYFIKKTYCSYDLSGLKDIYDVFYTKEQIRRQVTRIVFTKIICKMKNIFRMGCKG